MATTSVEAKNNVCVEEYLRLRKVWAKYKDQVEFSIRSRSSVTGRKIDVWFVAMKVGRDS